MDKTKLTLEELLSAGDSAARVRELSFEEGLKLLEQLVANVESGTLPLEQAVHSYEKGTVLVEHLRAQLEGAEEKLRILQKDNGDSGQNKGKR